MTCSSRFAAPLEVIVLTPKSWREWEKPLIELDDALGKLRDLSKSAPADKAREIESKIAEFEARRDAYIETVYSDLGVWEKVLVARAETRPYTLDYLNVLTTDFVELQGDRRFGQDHAIIGGPAQFRGRPVMVIGQQKGRNIQERQHRNFAMARPEGYRKAVRLMQMADRFGLPVVSFVDTPAADPSPESESRGISEAISDAILASFDLGVPFVAVILGEGGSGGAIGIATANRVLMLEHSVYSVIPPEGCAAILWRQPERGADAAAALQLTAQHAAQFGFVDEIVPEPFGGAHRDPLEAANRVGDALERVLNDLGELTPDQLREDRYEKYRAMGRFEVVEGTLSAPDPHRRP